MVEEPSEYSWSSYGCNALGIETELQTPHDLYLAGFGDVAQFFGQVE